MECTVAVSTWRPEQVAVSGTGETVSRKRRRRLIFRIPLSAAPSAARTVAKSWLTKRWSAGSKLPASVPGHIGYSWPAVSNQLSVSPSVKTKTCAVSMLSRKAAMVTSRRCRISSAEAKPPGSIAGRNGSKTRPVSGSVQISSGTGSPKAQDTHWRSRVAV